MQTILAVMGLGGWEVILILAVVLILFGAKRLPELAKGLGKGIKEFKNATRDVTDELQRSMDHDDQYNPPPLPRQVNYPSEKPAAEPGKADVASSAPHSSNPPKT